VRTASLVVCSSVFAALTLIIACSSSSDTLPTTPKKDAAPEPEPDVRHPFPSFRDDVAPIVFMSCALAACHSSKDSNLGIFLTYDSHQVYAEFQKSSPTAMGEKFVVPGDPGKSYLMTKLDGKQAALNAECANAPIMNCGTQMPPPDVSKLTSAQIETFRSWIMAGAKDDTN
jgi:hypothetical protein